MDFRGWSTQTSTLCLRVLKSSDDAPIPVGARIFPVQNVLAVVALRVGRAILALLAVWCSPLPETGRGISNLPNASPPAGFTRVTTQDRFGVKSLDPLCSAGHLRFVQDLRVSSCPPQERM